MKINEKIFNRFMLVLWLILSGFYFVRCYTNDHIFDYAWAMFCSLWACYYWDKISEEEK